MRGVRRRRRRSLHLFSAAVDSSPAFGKSAPSSDVVQLRRCRGLDVTTARQDSALKSIGIIMLAATMMLFARGSASSASNDGNLIVDSELNSVAGRMPQGWSVSTIPECGFRYEVRPDADGMSAFEIINDAPVESVLQQSVHLEPGWYSFTADI